MERAVLSPVKSLKEQVYDYLKVQLNCGGLRAGSFLNLNNISKALEISRTPLRDALFQLESEGLVTIFPRRGVLVNKLTLEKIRNIYEILGGLESSVIVNVAVRFHASDADFMDKCNELMRKALEQDNFSRFYEENLNFHNTYLDLSDNMELLHYVKILKERLYDFPRNKAFVKEWELHSLDEHSDLTNLLRRGDFNGAAEYIRDVHWSFPVQERFIRKYYFANQMELNISEEE